LSALVGLASRGCVRVEGKTLYTTRLVEKIIIYLFNKIYHAIIKCSQNLLEQGQFKIYFS
jgi:hypothetical protein